MRILKLLNNIYFAIIFFLLSAIAHTEDKPVDIWNLDKEKLEKNSQDISNQEVLNDIKTDNPSIYEMQSKKKEEKIQLEKELKSSEIKILGLYDPEKYDLDINMWTNSDGDQLKNIFTKLQKINFSNDAIEIMNISILTNAYYPTKNISEKEFLKFKSNWLIKNSDLNLIQNYLIKNQALDIHPKLARYYLDEYLSNNEIEKACEIFTKNLNPINDKYLSKFEIYCLIKTNKRDEAQIIFDLKKRLDLVTNILKKNKSTI